MVLYYNLESYTRNTVLRSAELDRYPESMGGTVMKKYDFLRRPISLLLAAAMLISMVPQAAPHVHAEEPDHEGYTHGEQLNEEQPQEEQTQTVVSLDDIGGNIE